MSDASRNAHLLEVGRAITEWAGVQGELYSAVAAILGCTEERASIVFFRTPSLEGRLTLADDLIKTVFPQTAARPSSLHPGHVVWNVLLKDIRTALPTRNSLAHHPVSWIVDFSKPMDNEIGVATTISHAESLRKKGVKHSPLKVDAIKSHAVQVAQYGFRLQEFRLNELAAQLQEPS